MEGLLYLSHFNPFIHQWTLVCFHFMAAVNTTAPNMAIEISVQAPGSLFLGMYPEVGLLDPVLEILFLRRHHAVSHSGSIVFTFQPALFRLAIFPYSCYHLLWSILSFYVVWCRHLTSFSVHVGSRLSPLSFIGKVFLFSLTCLGVLMYGFWRHSIELSLPSRSITQSWLRSFLVHFEIGNRIFQDCLSV